MSRWFAAAYVAGVVWLGGWELAAYVIDRASHGRDDWTLSAMTWLTLHLAFRVLR